MPSVSVCIANYKQDQFLQEAIESSKMQTVAHDIVIYNDQDGVGSGEAFNRAIDASTGDIVILLCADDKFIDRNVIADILKAFEDMAVGHVSRYYYQFIDGKNYPVRAWRGKDVIELANNPSGLAFRRKALTGNRLTNKMFVEAPTLVADVLAAGWDYKILPYDTVAVRIHNSTARSKDYYLKNWVTSPVEEWAKIGGRKLLTDYTSLIQIKNYFTTSAVLKECWNFIRLRPLNLINPGFWFFSMIALLAPRSVLYHIPDFYRRTWGQFFTSRVERP